MAQYSKGYCETKIPEHVREFVCIRVPGGGISADCTRWIAARPNFFLPVRVLAMLFRRLMLDIIS
jgi:hypothetical protein